MKRPQSATSLFVTGAAGLALVLARATPTRSAHAQSSQFVRDFYGEADEDVTAVTPAPSGMACGGLSVGSGLTLQSSEPPQGFTGACLMSRSYAGGLPSLCFSPSQATYLPVVQGPGGATLTQCTIPAANVAQPAWHIAVAADKVTREAVPATTRVLETCVPHLGHIDKGCGGNITLFPDQTAPNQDQDQGDCPCGTKLVSHSCCTQFSVAMRSDGLTAVGTAYFTSAAAADDGGQE